MKLLNRGTLSDHAFARKRRRLFTAAAGLGALAALTMPAARATSNDGRGTGKKVAMVVQLDGPAITVDQKIAAHLGARGYNVRMLDQARPPEAVGDADLVLISST
ncbi:hypothetical protein ACFFYR_23160, partial [Paraburkholderia dipogonis]